MLTVKCFSLIFVLRALDISYSGANDILGCNGFIKSNIEINFTRVEIKLMSKQGTLKDQTECAPNNGYYFLPLYDKGEYILKVAAPPGWTFEPSEFNLNADGVSDHCSLNKDINFEFKGFSIHGKVVGIGEEKGPQGIKVSLKSSNGKTMETVTGDEGYFHFKPVLPDTYVIEASHSKWRFHKSQTTVLVKNDNAQVPADSLVVSGYDVIGSVTTDNEPLSGVHFVAYASPTQKVISHGCETAKMGSFKHPAAVKGLKPVCYVSSSKGGQFVFPSLSPGYYTLVPFYQHESSVNIDIQPASLNFNVAHDSVILDTTFQIMGFSMRGRVLSSKVGSAVSNAAVYIDDRQVAVTGSNGYFTLDSMRTGTYRLGVRTEDMHFSDMEVKASPLSTELPPVYPTAYKVCGQVVPPSQDVIEPPRLVVFTSSSNGEVVFEEIWSKEKTGEFCLFLSPGKYHASISVSDMDRTKGGLQFAPLKREVIVKDSVVTSIIFSQLKAHLKGRVQCLDPELCVNFVLHLRNTATDQTIQDVIVKNGEYSVSNILPGEYEITLQNGGEWCWEQETVKVTIDSLQATAPIFIQTGVSVSFVCSHSTKVKYTLESNAKITGELNLPEGVSTMCVPKNGAYIFTPLSCHGYQETQYKWQSRQGPVTLTAISHQFMSKIVTDKPVDDLYANIMNNQNRLVKRLGPLKAKSSSPSHYEYEFSLHLAPHEQITVMPSASLLIFSPHSIPYVGHNDCQVSGDYFTAETGKLIEGVIKPPLVDVVVTVSNEQGVLIDNRTTNSLGKYKFGPFRMHEQLVVSAEKEGYVLSGPDSSGTFKAHKLAEVIVEVKDKADSSPLPGVLISLSGGKSYRRNSLTGPDGKVSFLSLSPNEYYLRPMMKEYKFQPASQIINVTEAATAKVSWSGVRIAYSALGSVTSLNGEPESGITVEALGVAKSGSDCDQLQEEAVTESTGQFRIRGLKPQCDYLVRVKTAPDVNQHIERAIPASLPVKVLDRDVTIDKRFTTLRPVTKCDVTVYIESKHLKTLTLKLYRSRNNDPIIVVKLKSLPLLSEQSALIPLTHVSIAEGVKYTLVLETNLNKNIYDLSREKLVREFQADSSYKLISYEFEPGLITVSEHVLNDMNNVLLCVILAGLAILAMGLNHYKHMDNLGERVREKIQSLMMKRSERERADDDDVSAVLLEAVPIVKRKSRAKKLN